MNFKLFTNKTKVFFILFALAVSFLLSSYLNRAYFVNNSPELRAYPGEYFVWSVKHALHVAKDIAFFWDKNKPVNQKVVADYLRGNLAPVAKGVRAAEEKNVSVTQYTLDKVEYIETSYTLSDGRVIKVSSPKGISPPPKEMFEHQ